LPKRGDLSRLKVDRALRKPAERATERLLAEFDAAGSVGRLNQDEQEAFGIGRGGKRGENRFHGRILAG
jgi:hypothetical protein